MKWFTILDVRPDPEYYTKNSFWVLIIAAIAAIVGLVIWFKRKKKGNQGQQHS